MKMTVKAKKAAAAGAAASFLLCATVTAGFGFPVEDFGSYVYMAQQLAQAVEAGTTAQSTLLTITTNLKRFANKLPWGTKDGSVPQDSVENQYGETGGWNPALNADSPAAASTAWQMANVGISPNTAGLFSGQTPGLSGPLASLAMVEAFDALSPDCLNAVGQYRDLRRQNAAAQAQLSSDELDSSDGTNTEIEQLNLLNAAEAQKMQEMKSQGALHACLAAQTTISNMAQRNAAALAINDAAIAQQEQTTNNTNFANESGTWQTYLP